jgi:hypothetical protein
MKPTFESLSERWDRYLDKAETREFIRARKLPDWRTRSRRRALSLGMLCGNVVLLVAAAIAQLDRVWVFLVLWCVGFLIWFVFWSLLRVVSGKMNSAILSLLDEREQQWRHRVTYIGFQAVVYLALIGMLYILILAISRQPDGAFRGAVMLAALVVLGTSAPTVVLGWTLPDDDPEDFREGGDSLA